MDNIGDIIIKKASQPIVDSGVDTLQDLIQDIFPFFSSSASIISKTPKYLYNITSIFYHISFYRKVKMIDSFLNGINNEYKESKTKKIYKENIYSYCKDEQVKDALVFYLDLYEEIEKSKFLSKLFYKLVIEDIKRDEFFSYSYILKSLPSRDFKFLNKLKNSINELKYIKFSDQVIINNNYLTKIFSLNDEKEFIYCLRLSSIGLLYKKNELKYTNNDLAYLNRSEEYKFEVLNETKKFLEVIFD